LGEKFEERRGSQVAKTGATGNRCRNEKKARSGSQEARRKSNGHSGAENGAVLKTLARATRMVPIEAGTNSGEGKLVLTLPGLAAWPDGKETSLSTDGPGKPVSWVGAHMS